MTPESLPWFYKVWNSIQEEKHSGSFSFFLNVCKWSKENGEAGWKELYYSAASYNAL